jgi:hypothetical protein
MSCRLQCEKKVLTRVMYVQLKSFLINAYEKLIPYLRVYKPHLLARIYPPKLVCGLYAEFKKITKILREKKPLSY